jgi:hypothetical protein
MIEAIDYLDKVVSVIGKEGHKGINEIRIAYEIALDYVRGQQANKSEEARLVNAVREHLIAGRERLAKQMEAVAYLNKSDSDYMNVLTALIAEWAPVEEKGEKNLVLNLDADEVEILNRTLEFLEQMADHAMFCYPKEIRDNIKKDQNLLQKLAQKVKELTK